YSLDTAFRAGRGAAPLGGDQFVEPAHLAFDGFEPVPVKFERVAVQTLAGAGESRTDALQPFFQAATPPFEDAQAHLGLGMAEEGEVDTEALVLPGRRARLGEELLQALLPFGGQLVDDLRSAAGKGRHSFWRRLLLRD